MNVATATLISDLLSPSSTSSTHTANPGTSVNSGSGALNAGSAETVLGSGSAVSGSVHAASKQLFYGNVYYGSQPPSTDTDTMLSGSRYGSQPAPIDTDAQPSGSRCCAGLTSPFSPRQSLLDSGPDNGPTDVGGYSCGLKSTKSALPQLGTTKDQSIKPTNSASPSIPRAQFGVTKSIRTSPLCRSHALDDTLKVQGSSGAEFPSALMRRFLAEKDWQKLTCSGWELHDTSNLQSGSLLCNVQAQVYVGEYVHLAIFREGDRQKAAACFDLMSKDVTIKLKKAQASDDYFIQIRLSSVVYRLAGEVTCLREIETRVTRTVQHMEDNKTKRAMADMMAGEYISDEE